MFQFNSFNVELWRHFWIFIKESVAFFVIVVVIIEDPISENGSRRCAGCNPRGWETAYVHGNVGVGVDLLSDKALRLIRLVLTLLAIQSVVVGAAGDFPHHVLATHLSTTETKIWNL